jgi:hypothetical protein
MQLISSRFPILLATAILCFSGTSAFAYIPETSYLFSQASKHQGKGTYIVTQDVVFKRNFDTVTVQEKWVLQDGLNSAVTVNSSNVQYQAIYDMTGRWIATDHGREHTEWPVDYSEGFFTARSVAQFYRLLQAANILTAEQLAGPVKTPTEKKEFTYVAQPYIRLTRTNGKPSWTFGLPTSESNSKGMPALWIAQDAFTVQRVRTKGGGDVQVGEYGTFVKGFEFPKTRHYSWNGVEVIAQVTRV